MILLYNIKMLLASYEQTETYCTSKFTSKVFIAYENPAIFLFRLQCSNYLNLGGQEP